MTEDLPDIALWLTDVQRETLCQRSSDPAIVRFLATRKGRSLEDGAVAASASRRSRESVFEELADWSKVDAGTLFRMLRGYGSKRWPNDGRTLACRICERYRGAVVAALRREVVEGKDLQSPYWAALSLVRLREWDPDLVRRRGLPWHWERMAPGYPGDDVYEAYVAHMTGGGRGERFVGDGGRDGDLASACGVWLATYGDEMAALPGSAWGLKFSKRALQLLAMGNNVGVVVEEMLLSSGVRDVRNSPWHVAGIWDEQSHHYKETLSLLMSEGCERATIILTEMGDARAGDKVFWGVDHGVVAAGMALDASDGLCETAWRSGRMVRMLQGAIQRGGIWVSLAWSWVAYGNQEVYSVDQCEFDDVARRVFGSKDKVRAVRCPLNDSWLIVPTDE
ncbi:MAG: hypothetical protein KDC98_19620 [Planctomycetes bacterium]|nr:hypothetical protein [Planctomycetota bacterium]